jgi:hypothetical protein
MFFSFVKIFLTSLRAFSKVANGFAIVPGLLSFPAGDKHAANKFLPNA